MRRTARLIRFSCAGAVVLPLLGGIGSAGALGAATDPARTEQSATDQRIAALQSALGITAAQMPVWTAFTQAMRDNAAATDALFRDRAASAATMSAADNMRSYAAVARAYADDTQKLSDSFQTLYGTLSPQQKQTADTLFREQAQKQVTKAK
ncbi:Spy/CpxP family protein refolding chaperone [Acetobacteraceae bacterium KSS8]|uniref:Spy/CpxP family protein refolding chaperone n=1 Tax=Endosaccharibacter trunci TaxID=2812733 RepID=A0ABT1W4T7_9PROT|nr:Spy/CpxP family protein refolding chaperone [Acetobacteraceae bacterium KSS8]